MSQKTAPSVFSAEISAAALAAAAARVAAITPGKTTIPIIGHALLRAGEGGGLQLAATNLDQALSVTLEAEAAGAVTVPAGKLAAIAALLDPKGTAKLSADETRMTLSQGRSTWKLPTLPAEDFPTYASEGPPAGAVEWETEAAPLLRAVKALEGTIDQSETRYYLVGVHFDLGREGAQALAATNGHTLGVVPIDGAPLCPSWTLPLQAFSPLGDLAKGHERLVLAMTETGIAATVQGAAGPERLRSKLVAGSFPDYPHLVPADRRHRVTVESGALLSALARVGLVDPDVTGEARGKARDRSTAANLEVGESEILVSAANASGEEAVDAVPCKRLAGGAVQARVTVRYLAWAATSLGEGTSLELAIESNVEPIRIRRAEDESGEVRIAMPRLR